MSITIPDGVTSIGDDAFRYCSGLENIYITDIASWCNISGISNLMAYGSSNKKLYLNNELITKLVIPDSVTSIGERAFSGCSGLTSITIPDSVTSIGRSAFNGCSGLTEVYYKGNENEWDKITIYSNNENLTSATRYYYSATKPTTSGNFWHYNSKNEIEKW